MAEEGAHSPIDIHLAEYSRLKEEQVKRIEFRDQMIHVHLALVGGAMGWALTQQAYHVLLVIPWICVILGWTYLVNDDRISALGKYVRFHLTPRVKKASRQQGIKVFRWEPWHSGDHRRIERKVIQFIVDLLCFVFSGFTAIGLLIWNKPPTGWFVRCVIGFECILLVGLAFLIFRYADFKKSVLPKSELRKSGR